VEKYFFFIFFFIYWINVYLNNYFVKQQTFGTRAPRPGSSGSRRWPGA
jgi:hypothetical protein